MLNLQEEGSPPDLEPQPVASTSRQGTTRQTKDVMNLQHEFNEGSQCDIGISLKQTMKSGYAYMLM